MTRRPRPGAGRPHQRGRAGPGVGWRDRVDGTRLIRRQQGESPGTLVPAERTSGRRPVRPGPRRPGSGRGRRRPTGPRWAGRRSPRRPGWTARPPTPLRPAGWCSPGGGQLQPSGSGTPDSATSSSREGQAEPAEQRHHQQRVMGRSRWQPGQRRGPDHDGREPPASTAARTVRSAERRARPTGTDHDGRRAASGRLGRTVAEHLLILRISTWNPNTAATVGLRDVRARDVTRPEYPQRNSGVPARCWRAKNAASSTAAAAVPARADPHRNGTSRRSRRPPSSARPSPAGRHRVRAFVASVRSPLASRAPAGHGSRPPGGTVPEKTQSGSAPGSAPRQDQADRGAAPRQRICDTEGPAPQGWLGEQPDDHCQADRRGRRPAGPLGEPRRDHIGWLADTPQSTEAAVAAGPADPLAADQVAQPPASSGRPPNAVRYAFTTQPPDAEGRGHARSPAVRRSRWCRPGSSSSSRRGTVVPAGRCGPRMLRAGSSIQSLLNRERFVTMTSCFGNHDVRQ